MASNLTDQNISDTYTQLLHIDGGSVSSQGKKRVRDGNGRPTAMSVSNNASASANKGIEVDGTVSADNLDLKSFNGVERQLGDNLIKALVDLFYPIGSLYLQGDIIDTNPENGVNSNDNLLQEPADRFPGTEWSRVSRGRYLIGVGASISNNVEPQPGGYTKTTKIDPYTRRPVFDPPATITKYSSGVSDPNGRDMRVFTGPDMYWVNQEQGGHRWNNDDFVSSYLNFRAGQYNITLDKTEMPAHTHLVHTGGVGILAPVVYGPAEGANHSEGNAAGSRPGGTAKPTGGDQPHENIPPWYGCLVWKRVK